MQYKGQLYGKVGNQTIPLEHTTEEFHAMKAKLELAQMMVKSQFSMMTNFVNHIVQDPDDYADMAPALMLIKNEYKRMKWSIETFDEATAESSLNKLEEEISEIRQDLKNKNPKAVEYADALMCLFDSAGRAGINPIEIFRAFEDKLVVNMNRDWTKNPDNTYSHVKSDFEQAIDENIEKNKS